MTQSTNDSLIISRIKEMKEIVLGLTTDPDDSRCGCPSPSFPVLGRDLGSVL